MARRQHIAVLSKRCANAPFAPRAGGCAPLARAMLPSRVCSNRFAMPSAPLPSVGLAVPADHVCAVLMAAHLQQAVAPASRLLIPSPNEARDTALSRISNVRLRDWRAARGEGEGAMGGASGGSSSAETEVLETAEIVAVDQLPRVERPYGIRARVLLGHRRWHRPRADTLPVDTRQMLRDDPSFADRLDLVAILQPELLTTLALVCPRVRGKISRGAAPKRVPCRRRPPLERLRDGLGEVCLTR